MCKIVYARDLIFFFVRDIITMYKRMTQTEGEHMPKICIDAGHYADKNRSPVNSNYYESHMAWDLHLLLCAALDARGIEYITTRPDRATDLDVYKRGKAAKGCDAFISLHSNAARNKDGSWYAGTHASAIHQVNTPGSEALAEALAQPVCDVMSLSYTKVYSKPNESKTDYYGVLRGAAAVGVPGVILECGFHTNYNTTIWLSDKTNLAKLAETIADGIASFFGIEQQLRIGDVNGDGSIDDADAELIKRTIQGSETLADDQTARADLNGDGKIDIRDYTILKRKYKS